MTDSVASMNRIQNGSDDRSQLCGWRFERVRTTYRLKRIMKRPGTDFRGIRIKGTDNHCHWGKFRAEVLARDRRCMNLQCEGRNRRLDAHHIVYRSGLGSDDLSNGIALCASCHHLVHNGFNDKKGGRITGRQLMIKILRQWLSTDGWRWDEAYARLLRKNGP